MTKQFDFGTVLHACVGAAEPGWRSRSACRGLPSDMFVSAELMTEDEELAAKRVCAGCAVVADCLTYSIVNAIRFGVGAVSPARSGAHCARAGFRTGTR